MEGLASSVVWGVTDVLVALLELVGENLLWGGGRGERVQAS